MDADSPDPWGRACLDYDEGAEDTAVLIRRDDGHTNQLEMAGLFRRELEPPEAAALGHARWAVVPSSCCRCGIPNGCRAASTRCS